MAKNIEFNNLNPTLQNVMIFTIVHVLSIS